MNEADRIDLAETVAYNVPAHIALRIVELGQERLKSIQLAGVYLDSRTAQVAGLQLAASAFVAAMITASARIDLTAWFAAASCFFFLAGAVVALLVIRSSKTQAAGIEPAWWAGLLALDTIESKLVASWAAKEIQRSIETAMSVDGLRAQGLNVSLCLGGIASLLAFLASATKLLPHC
ncbi:hypothetical protein [Caulobacter sp. S45]|uniref:hypothetical protein n=1 Tax=Caulobacter sp. S45 TaxID=1641861 RepID=UPI0015767BC0|nr:hypothetical protein [Caulobacter sp. S45]